MKPVLGANSHKKQGRTPIGGYKFFKSFGMDDPRSIQCNEQRRRLPSSGARGKEGRWAST